MPLSLFYWIIPGTGEANKNHITHLAQIPSIEYNQITPQLVPGVNWTPDTGPKSAKLAKYAYAPWVSSLIEFLQKIDLTLCMDRLWSPSPLQQNDILIMQLFNKSHNLSTLKDINAVRLYLRVKMLSEIYKSDGRDLSSNLSSSSPPFHQQLDFPSNWPIQPTPPQRVW